MAADIDALIERWRNAGPRLWAESGHGWIMETGEPIELIPWQAAVLESWMALKSSTTTLAISNVKKTGKTSLTALITAWRWLALPGTHFCCANDVDQAIGRHFEMITDMVRRNPFLSKNVKVLAKELIFEPSNSRLIALPVDPEGSAGANFMTASHTELWGCIHRAAVNFYSELTPPPGTKYGYPPLRVVDSYAGWEGASKTWHDIVDRGAQGELIHDHWPIFRDEGLLLFHMEGEYAQVACFRGDEDERLTYYAEQRRSLRDNSFTRLHLNRRTAGESNFCTQEEWELLIDSDLQPLAPTKEIPLLVGLDGATAPGGDDAALAAFYTDGSKVKLAWHKVWKGKTRKSRLKLSETVEPYLAKKAEDYNIVNVALDPFQLLRVEETLNGLGIRTRVVNQNQATLGPLGQAMSQMVSTQSLVLYDDPEVREAYAGVEAKEVVTGLHLKKAGTSRVDLMVAMSFAAPELWQRELIDWSKLDMRALKQKSKFYGRFRNPERGRPEGYGAMPSGWGVSVGPSKWAIGSGHSSRFRR